MKRTVKVTIHDFTNIKENLEDHEELELYENVNGHILEAEIESDGYAIIDLPNDQYIELAPDEFETMIQEWKIAGKLGDMVLETKSDPDDDKALIYRGVDGIGNVLQAPQSLPKKLVEQLAKAWFGTGKPSKSVEFVEGKE